MLSQKRGHEWRHREMVTIRNILLWPFIFSGGWFRSLRYHRKTEDRTKGYWRDITIIQRYGLCIWRNVCVDIPKFNIHRANKGRIMLIWTVWYFRTITTKPLLWSNGLLHFVKEFRSPDEIKYNLGPIICSLDRVSHGIRSSSYVVIYTCYHDDVIKWKIHIFRVTGHLCGVTRSFDVFFDLRLNKRLSKQS